MPMIRSTPSDPPEENSWGKIIFLNKKIGDVQSVVLMNVITPNAIILSVVMLNVI